MRALLTLPPTQIDSPSFSDRSSAWPGKRCIAVAAVHALLFDDLHRRLAVGARGRANGARRTGGNQRRHLARPWAARLVLDLRRPAMHAEDGDIGAVHGAAHVQAAGQGDAQLAGQVLCVKWSASASITAFTMPDASVAAEWQWTQPCVCTMLLIELLVPPTGNAQRRQLLLQRLDVVAASSSRNSTLLRLVKRRYPPQYLSASSANLRSVWMLSRRGEPARTRVQLVARLGHVAPARRAPAIS